MADNLRLLKNVFSALEKPLFLGDGLEKGEFHVLLQPGQFVSPNLTESDSTDDMAVQAALLDDIIDTKFIYTPLSGSISGQYALIMDDEALPYAPISEENQKEIRRDDEWIAENRNTYNVFKKYYFDALDAYSQEQFSQHPNPSKLSRLRSSLDEARRNWETIGLKNEFEHKQARVIYLSEGDPTSLWSQFRSSFTFNTKNAPNRGRYLQTFLVPRISEWNSPGTSWATYEKTIRESDSYSHSSETSWGGSGGVGWGLFSFGGGASGSTSRSYSKSDTTFVKIKFDYLRVRIQRPWLDSDIFGFHFWWWKSAIGYRLLCDGGNLYVTPPKRPIGILPFIQRHLIVVRNLTITSNFSENDKQIISSKISASASFGWGCFGCSGSYQEENRTVRTNGSFDGTTIRVDGPQIIAFTGTLMPRTPNPDRTLPWQGDQAPFDPPAAPAAAASQVDAAYFNDISEVIEIEELYSQINRKFDDDIANKVNEIIKHYGEKRS